MYASPPAPAAIPTAGTRALRPSALANAWNPRPRWTGRPGLPAIRLLALKPSVGRKGIPPRPRRPRAVRGLVAMRRKASPRLCSGRILTPVVAYSSQGMHSCPSFYASVSSPSHAEEASKYDCKIDLSGTRFKLKESSGGVSKR